ncbi:MAG TPA: hypothetical protein PK993_03075 [Clostridia bacterium]|nr:hypothetical protein [Clostridia bacterium]
MAKEFKQRTIKNDNEKYIRIVLIFIIAVGAIVSIALIINKLSKMNKINNSDNKLENNVILTENIKENTDNSFEQKLNDIIIDLEENNDITIPEIKPEEQSINKKNDVEQKIVRKYNNNDAAISGIQREMTMKQVEEVLNIPDTIRTETENSTGKEIKKQFYKDGTIEIDFMALYEKDKYIVHRMRTTNRDVTLTRGLKIGSTTDEIFSAFLDESILYKDTDLIVVGFPGEDHIYATTIKPKIYFKIVGGIVTEVMINIGSES